MTSTPSAGCPQASEVSTAASRIADRDRVPGQRMRANPIPPEGLRSRRETRSRSLAVGALRETLRSLGARRMVPSVPV
jgi:hypothetical protein